MLDIGRGSKETRLLACCSALSVLALVDKWSVHLKLCWVVEAQQRYTERQGTRLMILDTRIFLKTNTALTAPACLLENMLFIRCKFREEACTCGTEGK
jgi:hypothetical protein